MPFIPWNTELCIWFITPCAKKPHDYQGSSGWGNGLQYTQHQQGCEHLDQGWDSELYIGYYNGSFHGTPGGRNKALQLTQHLFTRWMKSNVFPIAYASDMNQTAAVDFYLSDESFSDWFFSKHGFPDRKLHRWLSKQLFHCHKDFPIGCFMITGKDCSQVQPRLHVS